MYERPRATPSAFHCTPLQWRALFLHQVAITAEHFGPVPLVLTRHTKNEECWYVVSDEPTNVCTFVEYGRRFDIEENFLDDKSKGFQLESSLVRDAQAMARRCLVLAVTTLYLVAQGTRVVRANKRRWVDPRWMDSGPSPRASFHCYSDPLMSARHHSLEHENDLLSHLLPIFLIKPSGNQQERFKQQPTHYQRADSSNYNPGV